MAVLKQKITDSLELDGPLFGLEAESEFSICNLGHVRIGEGIVGDVLNFVDDLLFHVHLKVKFNITYY